VLEQVREGLGVGEIIDADDFDVLVAQSRSENTRPIRPKPLTPTRMLMKGSCGKRGASRPDYIKTTRGHAEHTNDAGARPPAAARTALGGVAPVVKDVVPR